MIDCKLSKKVRKSDSETLEQYIERRKRDFNEILKNKYYYKGKKVVFKTYLNSDLNKEVFNHITTEHSPYKMKNGKPIYLNKPSLPRLERIHWIGEILGEVCDGCENRKCIVNTNFNPKRILICCEESLYMMVLEERKDYYLVETAYPISREKFEKMFNKSKRDRPE